MSTVITVENLGKKYTLSHQQREPYTALRDVITNGFRSFSKKIFSPFTPHSSPLPTSEDFWALKDVSFEVKQGDRIGIIGRNGAGKSTLLKILSRITEPTTGKVKIKGRVASLLEVGTGFHPELTGRENIFLNGAILGMGRAEIKKKFDEIVDFAEIEKFLDTPVKRYSSGMYVRLAFAVAAHLEPEILVVDEVLAVGDAQFQKKCLGKMEDVSAKEGRTVLFVSHNMGAVRSLCRSAIWLAGGQLHQAGSAIEMTEHYLLQNQGDHSIDAIEKQILGLPADPAFKLETLNVGQNGRVTTTVINGDMVDIVVKYVVFQRTRGLRIYFDLCDNDGVVIVRSFNDDDSDEMSDVMPGTYFSRASIPADFLAPKSYEIRIYGTIFNVRCVTPGGIGVTLYVERGNGINRAYPGEPVRASIQPRFKWETNPQSRQD